MAFTFAAFTYIVALIIDAFLIFFAIFHVSLLYTRGEYNAYSGSNIDPLFWGLQDFFSTFCHILGLF